MRGVGGSIDVKEKGFVIFAYLSYARTLSLYRGQLCGISRGDLLETTPAQTLPCRCRAAVWGMLFNTSLREHDDLIVRPRSGCSSGGGNS